MMKKYIISSVLFILYTAAYAQNSNKPVKVEPGVSLQLATYRAQVISDIQYKLSFNVTNSSKVAVNGIEDIDFNLKVIDQPLQLDFKQTTENLHKVTVNGKLAVVDFKDEHIVIPVKYLHAGRNIAHLEFTPAPASLNINTEYLYALFVPDHARTVFPCFDQPDLKGKFELSMNVPTGWKVLSNGLKRDSVVNKIGVTYNFANSDKLPTYLFSFTAGEYKSVKQKLGKREAEFLHRETDEKKIKFSTDSIFIAHQNAISFLEEWTGIPFPFQKIGFVAIPDFQFGGMEHPGEVQYKASSLFLDEGATKDQFIGRANLISHETAHMWFGDLVTMRWFNDVWMKEVFANFMADKVTEKMMGTETFNLKFLQDHYPAAYGVDRTQGTNPIRQQLDNLQEAGSMYGNIIYHKAPIMMRQLELLMGKENFQAGIREYLKKYAYSNATWPDLIAILSKHTKFNLYEWNKVWVNQPGRPVFNYAVKYNGSKISNLTITQTPEYGENRLWPQAFEITLVYSNHNQFVQVNMNNEKVVLKQVEGMEKPLYILFNTNGMGYGLFPTDKEATLQWYNIEKPLQRASTYIAAYENMLAGRYFKPDELLNLFSKGLTLETNEMNLRLINGYISNIYWNFTAPATRSSIATKLEQMLWDAMQQQFAANNKKIMFKTYQDIALSPEAKANIYSIWQKQQAPTGVKLAEDDYTSMALSIALKSDTVTSVIKQQQARITNADRKKRLDFLMPALSLDVKERDAFFNSLHERSNRQKEAWVTTGLSYLNHPLRQSTSIKHLPESLNMLEEIQKTGDIFFPQSWLGSIFGNYQSKDAAQIVRDFIKAHPNYNPKLKGKILQAADNVFRAEKLVN
ncbi:M1 family metallopeptidase [Mucilaginibacter terrae]|uniref:Aminopeptidase N n=1 Tax=Mucilaginibacter terrae TaxID=1955052 RepID=A0ABU3GPG0_9SPHI|nr:M1 family aminopeptidase [Mucilaginibacter terrae]MDT3401673.1 aminopeptidase N [Mucilaginibacter terrae]